MDAYAAWAPSYPPYAHNALMEVEQTSVLALLPPVAGRRVLDAGCGTGRYLQLLTALGARVVGIDRSEAMLARARCLSKTVALADMSRLPLRDASCDVVVSGLAVIDVADLTPVIAEWARVLCRRGVVVCSTLHSAGRELGWTRTYEIDGVRQTLPAHWHTTSDLEHACRCAGFDIDAIQQPALARDDQAVAIVIRARRR
jgi:malonyl-CoA O-methyltransferase